MVRTSAHTEKIFASLASFPKEMASQCVKKMQRFLNINTTICG